MSEPRRAIASERRLPAPQWDGFWDAIVAPAEVKDRLLATALLVLGHGRSLAHHGAPLSGLVVLTGPPGTGKSTLARGVANEAAARLAPMGDTVALDVDPHDLPSELLGESQRQVARLLGQTIPDVAATAHHCVVVVDEVEALAPRRQWVSFDTNPLDVHRAADAVLTGLDRLAGEHPGVLVVVTSNFPEALDEAFVDRADLVATLALPDADARAAIVAGALRRLAAAWPGLAELADDESLHRLVADATDGWDGRQLGKLPLQALAAEPTRVAAMAELNAGHLLAAVGAVGEGAR